MFNINIKINHFHTTIQEGLIKKIIWRELIANPNKYSRGVWSLIFTSKNNWKVSLVPREAVFQKKAIFWAYRGNRPNSTPVVNPKFINPSFARTTNKIKIVFAIDYIDFDGIDWDIETVIITAFPSSSIVATEEPGNLIRKILNGRVEYNQEELDIACKFWANHVLILEKGETYRPATTPEWYKNYWEKKYKKS